LGRIIILKIYNHIKKSDINKVLSSIILNYKWYFGIVILIAVGVSLQHYIYTPPVGSVDAKYNYTHYNNFLIFRQSYFHLIQHKDLYACYQDEYYDLYKYTPTFALLMAPFAYLPNIIGLILWNILNAVILFYAFRRFPFADEKKQLFAVGFILIEAITSLMISESNCLMAGLIVLAYIALEKKNTGLAVFLILLSVFIKPFGLVAFSLFLFYPGKVKAFAVSSLWGIILLALPLVVVSPHELTDIYKNWLAMLKNDHDISYGISVMAWLHTWFGIEAKNYALIAGTVLFVLPLARYKSFAFASFRQLFLASILIWVVIFNHKAESPAFIIAISGVAIWFSQSATKFNTILIVFAFLFTILSPTDLYPKVIREQFFLPYSIKVVPCIIIWVKILFELLTTDFSFKIKNLA
jgi:hypothetical protein